jgi:hypothetical protein
MFSGVQVALTEYSWGADADMNGATAQADVLGILGREGLDAATRWSCPDAATPTYQVITAPFWIPCIHISACTVHRLQEHSFSGVSKKAP